jgi:hypothetical protein
MSSTHHDKATDKAAEHHATQHVQPSSAAEASRKFREQQDAEHKAERERNAKAQALSEEGRVDRGTIDDMVKSGYRNIEQPGLDPANRPGNVLNAPEGERPAFKTTVDLEDFTHNPGHRGVTPYAPATSINRAPGLEGPVSINEPPDVEQPVPPQSAAKPKQLTKQSQSGQDDAVYDEKWEREDDEANAVGDKKKHK